MTPQERALLLAAIALGLGRAEPGVVSPDDKAFLATLIGANDWKTIVSGLMPLVRAVAASK